MSPAKPCRVVSLKNFNCKGCYYESNDRMTTPCVYCSRSIARADMYWNPNKEVDNDETQDICESDGA